MSALRLIAAASVRSVIHWGRHGIGNVCIGPGIGMAGALAQRYDFFPFATQSQPQFRLARSSACSDFVNNVLRQLPECFVS